MMNIRSIRVRNKKGTLFAACFITVFLATRLSAALIDVADLKVDRYNPLAALGLVGVQFAVHYELQNFSSQNCCAEEDLRWLQMAKSSHRVAFSPQPPDDPTRTFIDPRLGQHPGGFDELPFVDSTYLTLQAQNRNFGKGPYLIDEPMVLLSELTLAANEEYRFNAWSLLVCKEQNNTLGILGAFTWGYRYNGALGVQTLPIKIVSKPIELEELRVLFTPALMRDFRDWSIVSAATLWTPDQPGIPEPRSFVAMAGIALTVIGYFRLRRKQ